MQPSPASARRSAVPRTTSRLVHDRLGRVAQTPTGLPHLVQRLGIRPFASRSRGLPRSGPRLDEIAEHLPPGRGEGREGRRGTPRATPVGRRRAASARARRTGRARGVRLDLVIDELGSRTAAPPRGRRPRLVRLRGLLERTLRDLHPHLEIAYVPSSRPNSPNRRRSATAADGSNSGPYAASRPAAAEPACGSWCTASGSSATAAGSSSAIRSPTREAPRAPRSPPAADVIVSTGATSVSAMRQCYGRAAGVRGSQITTGMSRRVPPVVRELGVRGRHARPQLGLLLGRRRPGPHDAAFVAEVDHRVGVGDEVQVPRRMPIGSTPSTRRAPPARARRSAPRGWPRAAPWCAAPSCAARRSSFPRCATRTDRA